MLYNEWYRQLCKSDDQYCSNSQTNISFVGTQIFNKAFYYLAIKESSEHILFMACFLLDNRHAELGKLGLLVFVDRCRPRFVLTAAARQRPGARGRLQFPRRAASPISDAPQAR